MKWMTVREFVREGGYQRLTEPTVIASHGRPLFTAFPAEPGSKMTAERLVELNRPGVWDRAELADLPHR